MTFMPGDVVFFKEARRQPNKKSEGFKAGQGHAFGLLLGVVPPFIQPPDADMVFRLCASFGMVTIDSIIDLMGEEFGCKYVEKLNERYGQAPAHQPSGLVGANGAPLTDKKPELVDP